MVDARGNYKEEKSVAVIGIHYICEKDLHLKMKRHPAHLTSGNFTVTDYCGNILFEIKGKFREKVVCDPGGTPVFTIYHKLSAHTKWECYRGNHIREKDLLFTTRLHSQKARFMKTEIDVTLGNNKKEEGCDFKIRGNFTGTEANVYVGDSDEIIAQFERKVDALAVLCNKDSYKVTVSPNVDYAFVIALLVALDESKHVEGLAAPFKLID